MTPALGVLAHRPIQYQTPLYQLLSRRGNVDLDVTFLSDGGHRQVVDPGFGVAFAWDIDLLSGYRHQFLGENGRGGRGARIAELARWVAAHDVVAVNGYADPWMALAMGICRFRMVPYLLRGASKPQPLATGARRCLRHVVARAAVSSCACGLPVGQISAEFFSRYGARRMVLAPNSVDDERFARQPLLGRSELLARWQLPEGRPVIMFSGKLIPGKRPLDLVAAVRLLGQPVTLLMVGDGSLAQQVREALPPGEGVVTGFVNQSELPAYYHAADILVLPSAAEMWGLVINEAMAAGTLPVVSDRVGAAPDLVQGVGEVYPCGDINRLAQALSRALQRVEDPGSRDRVRRHVSRFSLERTAIGFEEAVMLAIDGRRPTRDHAPSQARAQHGLDASSGALPSPAGPNS